jgi:pyruvate/2-oxoglutarate dehydrogenase complex dihydrolipoamide acyltransferase (E2) component
MSELDFEATEAARDLAARKEVDLSTVDGTGVDGKIIKSDIEALDVPQDFTERGEWYDCNHCHWNTTHEQQMKNHIRAKHRS